MPSSCIRYGKAHALRAAVTPKHVQEELPPRTAAQRFCHCRNLTQRLPSVSATLSGTVPKGAAALSAHLLARKAPGTGSSSGDGACRVCKTPRMLHSR